MVACSLRMNIAHKPCLIAESEISSSIYMSGEMTGSKKNYQKCKAQQYFSTILLFSDRFNQEI